MNNISDYEAHKRDEQYEVDNSARLDAQWREAKKCPVHHTPLVAGVGRDGKLLKVWRDGGCAECFYQTEEWRELSFVPSLERISLHIYGDFEAGHISFRVCEESFVTLTDCSNGVWWFAIPEPQSDLCKRYEAGRELRGVQESGR